MADKNHSKINILTVFPIATKSCRSGYLFSRIGDFMEKSEVCLHMFNEKKMDFKVYEEKEGSKLWDTSSEVWKRIDEQSEVCNI